MKDLCQYGNRPEDEWEILPWIPDPRPPFKIWVKPEQIAPFFLIPHHPYAISLLLKISDGFRTEKFRRLGLTGSSGDWERLVRGVIREHASAASLMFRYIRIVFSSAQAARIILDSSIKSSIYWEYTQNTSSSESK